MYNTPLSFTNKRYSKVLFTLGLLGVLGSIGAFFVSSDMPDTSPGVSQIAIYVFMNLAIAVNEEFLFRGVIFKLLFDKWHKDKGGIWRAIIISSILFGLRHYSNLIYYPNQIVTTNAQVIFTFMAGIYLAALYLCGGNIWVCITVHFLEDIAVTIWEIFSSEAAISAVADVSVLQAGRMVFLQIPYVIFAILMIRHYRQKKVT